MFKKTIVRKKNYYDSVTLMSLTAKIKKEPGVEQVVIAMATEMNIEILENTGLITEEVSSCTPNDLVIAIQCEKEEDYSQILEKIDVGLKPKDEEGGEKKAVQYKTIDAACKKEEFNVAVISVPGAYAAYEAKKALENNLHVMLFSDNVTVEEEISLKTLAREKGLLVMGPDCGTAVLNNIGLCFANANVKGNIGIVAASGTGLQEVCVVIDELGGGLSQAIGVGGRDLSEKVGGIMMIEGIKALNEDENTEVILLVSKPPYPSVQEKIMNVLESVKKPVVICFIDGKKDESHPQYHYEVELASAARKTCELAGVDLSKNEESSKTSVSSLKYNFVESQKYLRGLFCGGTLCSEALSIVRNYEDVISNVAKKEHEKMKDPFTSVGNTLVDLGDDVFTNGKPHPMIEPSIRLDRIIQEAKDKEVKVILMDFEIGYGSNNDPAGVTVPAIIEAKEIAAKDGREIAFVGYVQGSSKDKQNKEEQIKKLEEVGVIMAPTNAQAVRLAVSIQKGENI